MSPELRRGNANVLDRPTTNFITWNPLNRTVNDEKLVNLQKKPLDYYPINLLMIFTSIRKTKRKLQHLTAGSWFFLRLKQNWKKVDFYRRTTKPQNDSRPVSSISQTHKLFHAKFRSQSNNLKSKLPAYSSAHAALQFPRCQWHPAPPALACSSERQLQQRWNQSVPPYDRILKPQPVCVTNQRT